MQEHNVCIYSNVVTNKRNRKRKKYRIKIRIKMIEGISGIKEIEKYPTIMLEPQKKKRYV